MHNMRPLVSVVMTVFNAEKYVHASICSILNQSYEDIELIIIDDGSTDASYAIASSFKDCRVGVYKQDHRGVTISLNKGLSIAKGHMIARQDADDLSAPNRLEKQIDFLVHNPEVALLGTFAEVIDRDGNTIKKLTFPVDPPSIRGYILEANPFIHGSVMFKRECLKECGMYREQFLLAQSYDLFLRISQKFPVAILPEFLYEYRLWDNAVTHEKAALYALFNQIARELAAERAERGLDTLMSGNNYGFYEAYGKTIVEHLHKQQAHRFL